MLARSMLRHPLVEENYGGWGEGSFENYPGKARMNGNSCSGTTRWPDAAASCCTVVPAQGSIVVESQGKIGFGSRAKVFYVRILATFPNKKPRSRSSTAGE